MLWPPSPRTLSNQSVWILDFFFLVLDDWLEVQPSLAANVTHPQPGWKFEISECDNSHYTLI